MGFDLDLTLVDSAAGISATFVRACAEVGVTIEAEAVQPYIGLPLDDVLRHLVPSDVIPQAAQGYRDHFPAIGLPAARLLPGAAEAIAAVQRHGGQAVVVTAKPEATAQGVLDHVGLAVDLVVGDRFAEAKGHALNELGAVVFVGDHPGDMNGARTAGVFGVGVTTGAHDPSALRNAGADVVLDGLVDFPRWLDEFVAWRRDQARGGRRHRLRPTRSFLTRPTPDPHPSRCRRPPHANAPPITPVREVSRPREAARRTGWSAPVIRVRYRR